MKDFVQNEEWQVFFAPVEYILHERRPGRPSSELVYTIRAQRLPHFYMFNLFAPAALLLVLGCMSFAVPVRSGEKTGTAVTVLLAVSVYMLILTDNVPSTSREISMLGRPA